MREVPSGVGMFCLAAGLNLGCGFVAVVLSGLLREASLLSRV